MSKQLITTEGIQKFEPSELRSLQISEIFTDTIQGEGLFAGVPATFLRLMGCNTGCKFCDTKAIYTKGKKYTFNEIFDLFENAGVIERLQKGQHLVITGGDPLLQEVSLFHFLSEFYEIYEFLPFIELENNCCNVFTTELHMFIACFNNSPKLANSGVDKEKRYNEKALTQLRQLHWNTNQIITFKFVVEKASDWDEIYESFIKPGLVARDQIYLMPEGGSWKHHTAEKKQIVVDLVVKEGVKYSPRLHIDIWNGKEGV